MAVSDPTGIRALTGIRVDGILVPVNAATEAGLQSVRPTDLGGFRHAAASQGFAVDLVISGTERLQFLPFAEATHVKLESSWPSPSFSGLSRPMHRRRSVRTASAPIGMRCKSIAATRSRGRTAP
jgi:inner membrane protein